MVLSGIMDFIILLLIAGVAMSLFSTVIMASYAILEADHKKKEIRRYVRRQIITQMEREKILTGPKQEPVDLLKEYR